MNNITVKFSRNELIAKKGQITLPLIAAEELLSDSKARLDTCIAEIITNKTRKGEKANEELRETGNSEIETIA